MSRLWLVTALSLVAGAAGAHPLAPALLELREEAGGAVEMRFKRPVPRVVGVAPEVLPPAGCAVEGRRVRPAEAGSRLEILDLRCDPPGLAGREIAARGIAESGTDVVLRVERADGGTVRSLLTAARPRFRVPVEESAAGVLGGYGGLGFRHILSGADHLLFVLGLVLLAGATRRLVWTITAFTAGHSVTLALASLGYVHVATAAVEASIAASILWLAVELTRDRAPTEARAVPVALAFGFGLLHGLGFAGALAEIGLPTNAIPLALFAFNVGIEVGQLAFVAALVSLAAAFGSGREAWRWPVRRASAYAIGIAAAFWMFERLAALAAPG